MSNSITPYICYPVAHDKGGGGSSSKTIIYTNRGAGSQIDTNNLTVTDFHSTNGNFGYIQASEGRIIRLSGKEIEYQYGYIGELKSDTIETKKLSTDDLEAIKGWIETLNSREITTEYLTVTKQAHFFELVIDKIKSVGGQLIITPANCIVDAAFAFNSSDELIPVVDSTTINNVAYYKVYWRVEDEVTHAQIHNEWEAGDQALCQSFNDVHEGTNTNVSSKYYWRVVDEVSNSPVYVNFNTGAVNYNGGGAIDKNIYEIQMLDTTYDFEGTTYTNNITWNAQVPDFSQIGIYPEVSWSDATASEGIAVSGVFMSASKTYGVNIKPVPNENGYPDYITDQLNFKIKQKVSDGVYKVPENINIGIYFTDDTFMTFNNVEIHGVDTENPDNSYLCHLDLMSPNMPIEAIVITSTADVDWHKCHWIKLSNNYIQKSASEPTKPAANSGCDYMLDPVASQPSRGDNLVQLGYRSNEDNLPLKNRSLESRRRQSAIIIAAYQSLDKGGQITCEDSPYQYGTMIDPIDTPSYAQYMGINSFSLHDFRHTYFDANGAKLIGDITMCSLGGGLIDDVIKKASETNMLVPNKEKVQVNVLSSGTIDEDDTVRLIVDLDYSINRNNASGEKEVSKNFSGFTLEFEAYGQQLSNGSVQDVKLATTSIPVSGNDAGKYSNSNYMAVVNDGTARPNDYMVCYKNSSYRQYCPVYLTVLLKNNGIVVDKKTVNVAFESGAVLQVGDYSIKSAVATSKDYTDGTREALLNDETFITQVSDQIDIGAISGWVTTGELGQAVEDLQSDIMTTAGMIRSEVSRTYGTTEDVLNSSTAVTDTTIDLTSSGTYAQDKFYKLYLTPSQWQYTAYNPDTQQDETVKHMFIVQIERNLQTNYGSWGKPDWGKQDSPYGVELMCNYSCITGSTGQWTNMQLYCNQYWLEYSSGKVISKLYKDTSGDNHRFFMWVRGGSKYTIRAGESFSASMASTSEYETLVNIDEPTIYRPSMSVIEQTAEGISLRVLEDVNVEGGVTRQELKSTGIDITSGSIVLDATKTRITGNLELTDAANGLTGFDSNGIPRVNLQPKPISTITPDRLDYLKYFNGINLTQQSSIPYFYSSPTDAEIIREGDFNLLISNLKIRLYTGAHYPSSNYITCYIRVQSSYYNETKEFRCTKRADNYYYMDNSLKFDIYNRYGSTTYRIDVNIKAFSSPSDSNANFHNIHDVDFTACASSLAQTYIGTDGFYSHSGSNQLLRIDPNYMQMQWGGCGIRMSALEGNILQGRLEILPDLSIIDNEIVPNWVSFYNYIPLIQVGTGYELFSNNTVYLNGSSQSKKAWQMDSKRHYGDIVVMALGGDNHDQESWIVLPPTNWTINGTNYHLPIGYKVTVWNYTKSENVIVTPYRSSITDTGCIVDSHGDANQYNRLHNAQRNDTYVYIGDYGTGGHTWLSMHDD